MADTQAIKQATAEVAIEATKACSVGNNEGKWRQRINAKHTGASEAPRNRTAPFQCNWFSNGM